MIAVRFFLTAVAPADLDEVMHLFREDVVPVFTAHPDCLGIELVIAEEPGVGGLVDGGVISRWTSLEAMERAVSSDELQRSQTRVRKLLRREPIRKVYRLMD